MKGGGALIVGFSLGGAALAGKASRSGQPVREQRPSISTQVDSWITINADNTATIRTGGIKQGTGSTRGC